MRISVDIYLVKLRCLVSVICLLLLPGFVNTAGAQICPNTPTPAFDKNYDNSSCLLNTTIKFADRSIANGAPITKWEWKFGDGQTSTDRNPTYTYKTYDKFDVTLTVYYGSGCSVTSAAQSVDTRPNLQPDFEFDVQSCPNLPVKFTDKSVTLRDPISTWVMNFGDQSNPVSYNDRSPRFHTYKKSGKYIVTLSLISANTPICVSDVAKKEIEVTAVNFGVCQGEITQFIDETVKPGTPGFTFNWDFGDAARSTLANPNTSTDQNPAHRYTAPGDYTVKLTVSSSNGCVGASATKVITVTGLPVANFDIENKNSLCGADSVTFIDKTDAAININRLVWFYDVTNHSDDSVVITRAQMRSDKKYRHFYGLNKTIDPIVYRARLVARIGGPCPDPVFTQDVIIEPTPAVTLKINGSSFNSPYALCAGTNPVTITASANITGKAVFTGTGIVNGNIFNPNVSGPGTFVINCLFTGDNTPCTYTTSFTIIVGSPVITLPATASVLEGTPIQLNPVITGNNLKFLWSPAIGVSDAAIRNPFFKPVDDTKYTLTVTTDGGCSVTAEVRVTVLKTPVIPNAFTPNNDGINDTWEIKYLDIYPEATVEVFNRFGAKVFTSNGYAKSWDGTFKGAILPAAVYYYVINPKAGQPTMSGSLTIIK
jgi:gliding motility-associated-like protein